MLNSINTGDTYKYKKLIITVWADGLEHNGARSSVASTDYINRYILHNVDLATDGLKHTFVKQMAIVKMTDEILWNFAAFEL